MMDITTKYTDFFLYCGHIVQIELKQDTKRINRIYENQLILIFDSVLVFATIFFLLLIGLIMYHLNCLYHSSATHAWSYFIAQIMPVLSKRFYCLVEYRL